MTTDLTLLEVRYLDKCVSPNPKLTTRLRLLEAAVTMFSKYGYAGASLRQISDLAGVKHGSIKYHYDGKESLWKATVDFLYTLMGEAMKADREAGDKIETYPKMREHMIAMTRTYIRFSAKHPELFRILAFEIMHESKRLDWIVENYSKPLAKASMRRIRQAKSAGVYPEDIPDLNLYYISMAASRTIFLLGPEVKRTFGEHVFDDDAIRRHEDSVIGLMFR